MMVVRKLCLGLAALALLTLLGGLATGSPSFWQPAAVFTAAGLALGLGAAPALNSYQYTAWILAAVVAAMIYPSAFLSWGGFDLRHKWLMLAVVLTWAHR